MIRYTFNSTGARMHSLHLRTSRPFSSTSTLHSKARVSQILEQAKSAVPSIYKTAKEKGRGDKGARRNQLIWLVKHSFGKEATAIKTSPHDLPWSTGNTEKKAGTGKCLGGRMHVTVWPHLW